MAFERTLFIIKPDAVEQRHVGEILAAIETSGLVLRALRMMHLTRGQAEAFYAVHRARPFFDELVRFMTRGPVVVGVLEGDDAIARWRTLMGATDPAKAAEGTVRRRFGRDVGENAVHGSDSPETARTEVAFFFPGYELG
ncbi:MAG: nucleoside-diphosphate kinase [Myxococcota bacterium]|nr:nucleoside-diphosphate kinase [Myxococcota bacterium]MDW8360974.1 nucleoside-diphosphate kinase [Myxococcales bacterium]